MIQISKRLETIAKCVGKCNVLADIGTDHAYLPIYVMQNKIANKVIAMDVRKGPLKKAKQNILESGCNNIELRLSDGLEALEGLEADVITISGMGGRLMEKILQSGREHIGASTRLILSPQSEVMHFRMFLNANGFLTEDEIMVEDEEKIYVIIVGSFADAKDELKDVKESKLTSWDYACYKYGSLLIEKKDEILFLSLDKEEKALKKIKENLRGCESDNVLMRLKQIDYELEAIKLARSKGE